jgi:hypothetical protein
LGTKSGAFWVSWANVHATSSKSIGDLVEPFRTHADSFVKALTAAGAHVDISVTKRSDKRAYLFHWCWLIGLGFKKASDAPPKAGVLIDWEHGDDVKSKKGAKEMITGFGLAVPPASTNAPALGSNHIAGKAIDMTIAWTGSIAIKKPDGTTESVAFMPNVNANIKLHAIGALYGVKKLVTDAPHWSYNGH